MITTYCCFFMFFSHGTSDVEPFFGTPAQEFAVQLPRKLMDDLQATAAEVGVS